MVNQRVARDQSKQVIHQFELIFQTGTVLSLFSLIGSVDYEPTDLKAGNAQKTLFWLDDRF